MTKALFGVLAALVLTGPAAAQSFDCAKASSKIEKRLCAAPELGFQDSLLATLFSRALDALPAQRDALLAQQRAWVKSRDAACAPQLAQSAAVGSACLDAAYSDRIKAIAALAPDEKTDPALCRRVADLYRAWAGQPKILAQRNFDVYDFLSQSASAAGPIRLVTSEMVDGDKKALLAWAAKHKPPLVLPGDLLAKLTDDNNAALEMVQAPGTEFYAAQIVAGTAHCYNSTYFSVASGKARAEPVPPDWSDDEGASCGATRFFGALDGKTVAFEIPGDLPSDLHERLTLMAWRKDHFQPACDIDFAFTPHIDAKFGLSDPDNQKDDCSGADCPALKKGAMALVEQIQLHGCAARETALAALSPAQSKAWEHLTTPAPKTDEPAEAPDCSDPKNLTDSAPLALPLPVDGQVFRADIGHVTVGWRIYSDWKASLAAEKRQATFYFGLVKGPEVAITVK